MSPFLYQILQLGDCDTVRLLTKPYQYVYHKISTTQKKKCTAVTGVCDICSSGNKPRTRWLIGVINRSDGKFYLIDIGWATFSSIRNLVRDPERGNPYSYDIRMTKCKDYVVDAVALTKTPLTEQELALQSNIDSKYLTSLCDPTKEIDCF